ncbi:MAG: DNA polymerase III subunit alpha [bacterium]
MNNVADLSLVSTDESTDELSDGSLNETHQPPRFVHLRLHSEYSLVDSTIRIDSLMTAVAKAQMPSVAMTDQMNFYALVKFYNAAIGAGIKPIFGVDVLLREDHDAEQQYHLILLCQTNTGYRNLTKLISAAYLRGQVLGVPLVTRAQIQQYSEGVIALSGGREGDVGKALLAGNLERAEALLSFWRDVFPNRYYLELQRTNRNDEERYLHAAIALAEKTATPVVATNDTRFLAKDDFAAHEARVCIGDGYVLEDSKRPRHYSEEQYLKTPEQMQALFADIPEALQNTVEIAKRCNVSLTLWKNYLPEFPIPEGLTEADYFCQVSQAGLEERLDFLFDRQAENFAEIRKAYDERLAIELGVINQMGFPGYFLIVADFIQWAKDHDIPVGPGRGSGAGSLVAYALKITDLDPLAYDLLFERFLNPERVSMPDFDIDFCMDKRDQVIDYVSRHYGKNKVSQIITYGSMAAKAVVRDVGRVFGHPYGFVDRVAKMIPPDIGMTLTKAMEASDDLKQSYDNDEEVRDLLDMAMKLEGLSRNVGKHAGGVLIAPTDLTDFTPLYCEPDGTGVVSQFDKNDVEAVGLVKFDFLGLRNLTIIDQALQSINQQRVKQQQAPLEIARIDLDDKKTFDLLKAHKTTAVFQLESRGMKDLIRRLQPDVFEDIIALVALYRPGPLGSGMVDDFIQRKRDREVDIEYPHPKLETILEPTYGVILYQEQVMQIAQVLANYSLGGADLLRRAMGKKKVEEMEKQRVLFMKGAADNQVDESTANYIFDLMAKFAGYGFNKSHSAAYALVSYQTAWLKAHYPEAFMAAVLSADMDNTEKVVTLIDDCRQLGLTVLAPDINRSAFRFTVGEQSQTIIYGLGAIKGAGEAALEVILAEREAKGAFESLVDLCQRVNSQKVTKRILETLIKAGTFDSLGINRRSVLAFLPEALRIAGQHQRDQGVGQVDLFGGVLASDNDSVVCPVHAEWEENERLAIEKAVLGLYLTGHPINAYQAELRQFTNYRLADLTSADEQQQWQKQPAIIAGLVTDIRTQTTERGKRAFVQLDDQSAYYDVLIFPDVFEKSVDFIQKDQVIVLAGKITTDKRTKATRFRVEQVYDLTRARQQFAKQLRLTIQQPQVTDDFMQLFATLCVQHGTTHSEDRHTGSDDSVENSTNELADIEHDFVGNSPIDNSTDNSNDGKVQDTVQASPYCPVMIRYQRPDVSADIRLDSQYGVDLAEGNLALLRKWLGDTGVEICY